MKVKIVGLQHRNTTKEFISKLSASSIGFEREPKNPYDKFAVKCISEGVHFGYVEKKYSKLISTLIVNGGKLEKKIDRKEESFIELGANPNAKTIKGNTARDIAKQHKNFVVSDILNEAIKDATQ